MTAFHVVFDEAMTDSDLKTLNSHLLCSDSVLPAETIDLTSDLACLNISMSPFTTLSTLQMPFEQTDHLPFSIEVATCSWLHWVYITSFSCAPIGHLLHTTHSSFLRQEKIPNALRYICYIILWITSLFFGCADNGFGWIGEHNMKPNVKDPAKKQGIKMIKNTTFSSSSMKIIY